MIKSSASAALMGVGRVTKAGIAHPFGDSRTVNQAFPSAVEAEEADPFLMCDYFDMVEKNGPAPHEDIFPVDWHPHKGFDICSYIRSGLGRHADSLGNRETYESPGMQWMSTGSGVEHAEAGANPKGTRNQGFQIWINVPSSRKLDDPRYGTVPTSDMVTHVLGEGSMARILAGDAWGLHGPFETVQRVQMIDFELKDGGVASVDVDKDLDTAILYVYEGSLSSINGISNVEEGAVIVMDATDTTARTIRMACEDSGCFGNVMLFAGKKIREPIAWRGPIVMNTFEEIRETFMDMRAGRFPPKRVAWNYKRAASRKEEL